MPAPISHKDKVSDTINEQIAKIIDIQTYMLKGQKDHTDTILQLKIDISDLKRELRDLKQ